MLPDVAEKSAGNRKNFTGFRKKSTLCKNLYLIRIIQEEIGIVKNQQTA